MHALDVWIEARGAIHRRRLVFASSAEFRARFVYPADLFVALQRHADALHLDDDDEDGDSRDDSDDGGGWDMDQRNMYVLGTADARRRRYARRGAWELEDGADEVEESYAQLGTRLSRLSLGTRTSAGSGWGAAAELPEDDDELCQLLLQSNRHPHRDWPFQGSNCCYQLDLLTSHQLGSLLRDMEVREWNDVIFVRDVTKKRRKMENGGAREEAKMEAKREVNLNDNKGWLGRVMGPETWNLILGISKMSIRTR